MGGAGEAADVRPHAAGHHPQGAGRGRRQGGRGRGGHREPGPARRAGAHGARLQGRGGRQRAPDAPLQGPARPVSTRTPVSWGATSCVRTCNQLTNAWLQGGHRASPDRGSVRAPVGGGGRVRGRARAAHAAQLRHQRRRGTVY